MCMCIYTLYTSPPFTSLTALGGGENVGLGGWKPGFKFRLCPCPMVCDTSSSLNFHTCEMRIRSCALGGGFSWEEVRWRLWRSPRGTGRDETNPTNIHLSPSALARVKVSDTHGCLQPRSAFPVKDTLGIPDLSLVLKWAPRKLTCAQMCDVTLQIKCVMLLGKRCPFLACTPPLGPGNLWAHLLQVLGNILRDIRRSWPGV